MRNVRSSSIPTALALRVCYNSMFARARSSNSGNPTNLLFWNVTEKTDTDPETRDRKGFVRSFFRWLVICAVLLWLLAAMILLAARWIDPPTTAVHVQRRVQAWNHHTPYHKRYKLFLSAKSRWIFSTL